MVKRIAALEHETEAMHVKTYMAIVQQTSKLNSDYRPPPPRMPSRKPPALSTTMIHGDIVNIRDAILNMPIHQVNELVNRDKALDLLRSHCSLTALVDASQRYDPPRCAEATRRDIIQRLENWVHHDNPHRPPSSIFWLFGGAGAGKSALAQTLAERFKTNEDLAASFFFFKADVNRNDGDRLIPTLALQLGQSFQGLTPIVEDMILQNPDLFNTSRQTQMLELLVAPLIRLSLEETDGEPVHPNTSLKSHPRLVVIDGLDECIDSNIQFDLLRIIAIAIPHFPYPLRFLITSRPESHITRAFRHVVGRVAQYDLSDDLEADKDIRKYLDEEFVKIRRTHPLRHHLPPYWPCPADVSPIVERSSAHFIYASTAIRFIQSPKHRPDDRLQVILGLKQPYREERPYAPLDALYSLVFLEIQQDSSQLEKIHRALGIMHLRSTKIGLFSQGLWEQASDSHVIELLLGLRPGDLILLFDPLLSLVTFEEDNIRILHKSLFDYLLDSTRSGGHQLDLSFANESAANYMAQRKKLKDRWDFEEFQDFVYHCQFAPLNHTWRRHARHLACDPKITFRKSLSRLIEPHKRLALLQTILHFLQVINRQDFDPSGHCYRQYVRNNNQSLRSAVPLIQRMKYMIFRLKHPVLAMQLILFERDLRSSLEDAFESVGLKDLARKTSIPNVDTSIIKSLEPEHKMFSSYVKAHSRFSSIVVSFQEQSSGFIHSCHFVLERVPAFSVTFIMLVTYTEYGVRLSCTEFEGHTTLRLVQESRINYLMEEHFRSTRTEVENNRMEPVRMVY